MLHLELPHVNVLSKIDLLRHYGRLGARAMSARGRVGLRRGVRSCASGELAPDAGASILTINPAYPSTRLPASPPSRLPSGLLYRGAGPVLPCVIDGRPLWGKTQARRQRQGCCKFWRGQRRRP